MLALAAAYAVQSIAMRAIGMIPIEAQAKVRAMTLSKRGKVCVYNMHPNLCLDWQVYKQTGNTMFVDGAERHLDASLEAFVNEGRLAIEFGGFDVKMGKMVRHFTILGARDDSCWSRG